MVFPHILRLVVIAGFAAGTGLLFSVALSARPHSQEIIGDAQKGEKIASERCGACHALGERASTNKAAVPLAMLLRTLSVEEISEALKGDLATAHETAPRISLSPADQTDLMQYLRELATGEEG